MEGYSVTEAASVLGVPTERVWELLARGILSGAPDGETGMRVFLQPRPTPLPPAVDEARQGGGSPPRETEVEASPFRELLTEFRNLTERYGQALLALGESRGEVASLRSRVDLLEARIDLRLPMQQPITPAAAAAAAWGSGPPSAAPPSEASAEPPRVADVSEEHPTRRRRSRGHRATDDFAQALARAEDPSPAELPGAAEAAAALAALRNEVATETEPERADDAVLPRELPAAVAFVADLEPEPFPEFVLPRDTELELEPPSFVAPEAERAAAAEPQPEALEPAPEPIIEPEPFEPAPEPVVAPEPAEFERESVAGETQPIPEPEPMTPEPEPIVEPEPEPEPALMAQREPSPSEPEPPAEPASATSEPDPEARAEPMELDAMFQPETPEREPEAAAPAGTEVAATGEPELATRLDAPAVPGSAEPATEPGEPDVFGEPSWDRDRYSVSIEETDWIPEERDATGRSAPSRVPSEASDARADEESASWFGRPAERERPAWPPEDDPAAEMEVASSGSHGPPPAWVAQDPPPEVPASEIAPVQAPRPFLPPAQRAGGPVASDGPASRAYRRLRRIFPG